MEAEDSISEVEDRILEINEAERKKEKRTKRNEDNLRDLWDNVKCPNIRIIGVPEKVFRTMMVKMIQNLENKMELYTLQ